MRAFLFALLLLVATLATYGQFAGNTIIGLNLMATGFAAVLAFVGVIGSVVGRIRAVEGERVLSILMVLHAIGLIWTVAILVTREFDLGYGSRVTRSRTPRGETGMPVGSFLPVTPKSASRRSE